MEISETLYNKLIECNWLENCGTKRKCQYSFEAYQVMDTHKMLKNIQSIKWENACLDKRGYLTEYLCLNVQGEYDRYWNTTVRTIKANYLPKILDKIQVAIGDNNLPEEVMQDIRFNVLNIFMAEFYSAYYVSEFSKQLLEIYLSGHLPCGWHGKYPDGMIMMF